MSKRYVGGFISTSPPTAYTNSVTPGVWTLEEQIQKVYGNNWQFYPPGGFFQADVLIVAGGGGGGGAASSSLVYLGGSGGGGGVVYISALQSLTKNTYSVSVGAGGLQSTNISLPGTNGDDSYITGYFYNVGNYTIRARGGSGGSSASGSAGSAGGSGGGGGAYMTVSGSTYYMTTTSASTTNQSGTNSTSYFPTLMEYGINGNNSGKWSTSGTLTQSYIYSGAGGGATSQGLDQVIGSVTVPIIGGQGFLSTIAGTTTYYGTGASSAFYRPGGTPSGTTYAQASANGSSASTFAQATTGAGGAGQFSTAFSPKPGASGTVIIKYLQTTANITFSGATVVQSSPYTIAKFVNAGSSMSFTINDIYPYVNQQF